jgi:hypothetical protein
MRFTNTGSVAWSSTFGGAGTTQPMVMALGPKTLYMAGFFEQTAAFGSIALGPSVAAGRDAFVTQVIF